eukprot:TRINITY_DN8191_c0_g1_i1.p1 TRINITY_DN8191_c0_g1~~TRINITY_DN8191_c0_g1_i1.p1  ORF type:complete len:5725 (+),score=1595.64 TRINITY_DN8191_c0_g1_i1:118-17292(+)
MVAGAEGPRAEPVLHVVQPAHPHAVPEAAEPDAGAGHAYGPLAVSEDDPLLMTQRSGRVVSFCNPRSGGRPQSAGSGQDAPPPPEETVLSFVPQLQPPPPAPKSHDGLPHTRQCWELSDSELTDRVYKAITAAKAWCPRCGKREWEIWQKGTPLDPDPERRERAQLRYPEHLKPEQPQPHPRCRCGAPALEVCDAEDALLTQETRSRTHSISPQALGETEPPDGRRRCGVHLCAGCLFAPAGSARRLIYEAVCACCLKHRRCSTRRARGAEHRRGTVSLETQAEQGDEARMLRDLALAFQRNRDACERMLEKGTTRRPRQPLHLAIQLGQLSLVVQILKERHARGISPDEIVDPTAPGWSAGWRETPLMTAVQAFHLPSALHVGIVQKLLEYGARLDERDSRGRGPLTLAVMAASGAQHRGRGGKEQLGYAVGTPVLCAVVSGAAARWRAGEVIARRERLSVLSTYAPGPRERLLHYRPRCVHDVRLLNGRTVENCPGVTITRDCTPHPDELKIGADVLYQPKGTPRAGDWMQSTVIDYTGQGERYDIKVQRLPDHYAVGDRVEVTDKGHMWRTGVITSVDSGSPMVLVDGWDEPYVWTQMRRLGMETAAVIAASANPQEASALLRDETTYWRVPHVKGQSHYVVFDAQREEVMGDIAVQHGGDDTAPRRCELRASAAAKDGPWRTVLTFSTQKHRALQKFSFTGPRARYWRLIIHDTHGPDADSVSLSRVTSTAWRHRLSRRSRVNGVHISELRTMPVICQKRARRRETTEGLLYPGAEVEVSLATWEGWRRGVIQGRNDETGDYNVRLHEDVDEETGKLADREKRKVHLRLLCYARTAGRADRGTGERHPEEDETRAVAPNLALLTWGKHDRPRLQKGVAPAPAQKAPGTFLGGARAVSITHIRLPRRPGRGDGEGKRIIAELARERRQDKANGGFFVPESRFMPGILTQEEDSDGKETREETEADAKLRQSEWHDRRREEWEKKWAAAEPTARKLPPGTVDTDSVLAGTGVVAIAAGNANLSVLRALEQEGKLVGAADLRDRDPHSSLTALELATDPRVLRLFARLLTADRGVAAKAAEGCAEQDGDPQAQSKAARDATFQMSTARAARGANRLRESADWEALLRELVARERDSPSGGALSCDMEEPVGGLNALCWGCWHGNIRVLRELLREPRYRALLGKPYAAGAHPIYLAVRAMVPEGLVKGGADPEQVLDADEASYLLRRPSKVNVINLLLHAAGPEGVADTVRSSGAVGAAAQESLPQVLTLLLSHGGTARDPLFGLRPYQLAHSTPVFHVLQRKVFSAGSTRGGKSKGLPVSAAARACAARHAVAEADPIATRDAEKAWRKLFIEGFSAEWETIARRTSQNLNDVTHVSAAFVGTAGKGSAASPPLVPQAVPSEVSTPATQDLQLEPQQQDGEVEKAPDDDQDALVWTGPPITWSGDSDSALAAAVRAEDHTLVGDLLSRGGADVNEEYNCHGTDSRVGHPIAVACRWNSGTGVLRQLLDHGATLHGTRALACAAARGHRELTRMLLTYDPKQSEQWDKGAGPADGGSRAGDISRSLTDRLGGLTAYEHFCRRLRYRTVRPQRPASEGADPARRLEPPSSLPVECFAPAWSAGPDGPEEPGDLVDFYVPGDSCEGATGTWRSEGRIVEVNNSCTVSVTHGEPPTTYRVLAEHLRPAVLLQLVKRGCPVQLAAAAAAGWYDVVKEAVRHAQKDAAAAKHGESSAVAEAGRADMLRGHTRGRSAVMHAVAHADVRMLEPLIKLFGVNLGEVDQHGRSLLLLCVESAEACGFTAGDQEDHKLAVLKILLQGGDEQQGAAARETPRTHYAARFVRGSGVLAAAVQRGYRKICAFLHGVAGGSWSEGEECVVQNGMRVSPLSLARDYQTACELIRGGFVPNVAALARDGCFRLMLEALQALAKRPDTAAAMMHRQHAEPRHGSTLLAADASAATASGGGASSWAAADTVGLSALGWAASRRMMPFTPDAWEAATCDGETRALRRLPGHILEFFGMTKGGSGGAVWAEGVVEHCSADPATHFGDKFSGLLRWRPRLRRQDGGPSELPLDKGPDAWCLRVMRDVFRRLNAAAGAQPAGRSAFPPVRKHSVTHPRSGKPISPRSAPEVRKGDRVLQGEAPPPAKAVPRSQLVAALRLEERLCRRLVLPHVDGEGGSVQRLLDALQSTEECIELSEALRLLNEFLMEEVVLVGELVLLPADFERYPCPVGSPREARERPNAVRWAQWLASRCTVLVKDEKLPGEPPLVDSTFVVYDEACVLGPSGEDEDAGSGLWQVEMHAQRYGGDGQPYAFCSEGPPIATLRTDDLVPALFLSDMPNEQALTQAKGKLQSILRQGDGEGYVLQGVLTAADQRGSPLLCVAAAAGDAKLVAHLLRLFDSPSVANTGNSLAGSSESVSSCSEVLVAALVHAAAAGRLDTVRFLLNEKAYQVPVDAVWLGGGGRSAGLVARHRGVIRELLSEGHKSPDHVRNPNVNLAYCASQGWLREVGQALHFPQAPSGCANPAANVAAENGDTPLLAVARSAAANAARRGATHSHTSRNVRELLRLLLHEGAEPCYVSPSGATVLSLAAETSGLEHDGAGGHLEPRVPPSSRVPEYSGSAARRGSLQGDMLVRMVPHGFDEIEDERDMIRQCIGTVKGREHLTEGPYVNQPCIVVHWHDEELGGLPRKQPITAKQWGEASPQRVDTGQEVKFAETQPGMRVRMLPNGYRSEEPWDCEVVARRTCTDLAGHEAGGHVIVRWQRPPPGALRYEPVAWWDDPASQATLVSTRVPEIALTVLECVLPPATEEHGAEAPDDPRAQCFPPPGSKQLPIHKRLLNQALCLACRQQRPNCAFIGRLLEHGAPVTWPYEGVGPLRNITATGRDAENAAEMLLKRLIQPGEAGTALRSHRIDHARFMHVVEAGWDHLVQMIVEGAPDVQTGEKGERARWPSCLRGYRQRALPQICEDTLREALKLCIAHFRPKWQGDNEHASAEDAMLVLDPAIESKGRNPGDDKMWNVLRSLLSGIHTEHVGHHAHGDRGAANVQVVLNELLLPEDIKVLGMVPFQRFWQATDPLAKLSPVFFSGLFDEHQFRLKRALCHAWRQHILGQVKVQDPGELLLRFQYTVAHCNNEGTQEFAGGENSLEMAAACGWVEAAEWLLQQESWRLGRLLRLPKISVHDSHSVVAPISDICALIRDRYAAITSEELMRVSEYMNSAGQHGYELSSFVELMRTHTAPRDTVRHACLSDIVLIRCRDDPLMLALVSVAVLLLRNGANVTPMDVEHIGMVIRLDGRFSVDFRERCNSCTLSPPATAVDPGATLGYAPGHEPFLWLLATHANVSKVAAGANATVGLSGALDRATKATGLTEHQLMQGLREGLLRSYLSSITHADTHAPWRCKVECDCTLLHTAAHVNNLASVSYILRLEAYGDTIGSGVLEDQQGRTARHYTSSHDVHQMLAEREGTDGGGYVPPLHRINVVVAIRVQEVSLFGKTGNPVLDAVGKLVEKVMDVRRRTAGAAQENELLGESTLMHVLRDTDLGGYIIEFENVETNTKDRYVAVSSSEKRQRAAIAFKPGLATGDEPQLLSREEYTIVRDTIETFTRPLRDDDIAIAIDCIESAVLSSEAAGAGCCGPKRGSASGARPDDSCACYERFAKWFDSELPFAARELCQMGRPDYCDDVAVKEKEEKSAQKGQCLVCLDSQSALRHWVASKLWYHHGFLVQLSSLEVQSDDKKDKHQYIEGEPGREPRTPYVIARSDNIIYQPSRVADGDEEREEYDPNDPVWVLMEPPSHKQLRAQERQKRLQQQLQDRSGPRTQQGEGDGEGDAEEAGESEEAPAAGAPGEEDTLCLFKLRAGWSEGSRRWILYRHVLDPTLEPTHKWEPLLRSEPIHGAALPDEAQTWQHAVVTRAAESAGQVEWLEAEGTKVERAQHWEDTRDSDSQVDWIVSKRTGDVTEALITDLARGGQGFWRCRVAHMIERIPSGYPPKLWYKDRKYVWFPNLTGRPQYRSYPHQSASTEEAKKTFVIHKCYGKWYQSEVQDIHKAVHYKMHEADKHELSAEFADTRDSGERPFPIEIFSEKDKVQWPDRAQARQRVRAMWGFRQLHLAAGLACNDPRVPYPELYCVEDPTEQDRSRSFLERLLDANEFTDKDAKADYRPQRFGDAGQPAEGQRWIESLLQNKQVQQMFGVHNKEHATDVLELFMPYSKLRGGFWASLKSGALHPMRYEPFRNIDHWIWEGDGPRQEVRLLPGTKDDAETIDLRTYTASGRAEADWLLLKEPPKKYAVITRTTYHREPYYASWARCPDGERHARLSKDTARWNTINGSPLWRGMKRAQVVTSEGEKRGFIAVARAGCPLCVRPGKNGKLDAEEHARCFHAVPVKIHLKRRWLDTIQSRTLAKRITEDTAVFVLQRGLVNNMPYWVHNGEKGPIWLHSTKKDAGLGSTSGGRWTFNDHKHLFKAGKEGCIWSSRHEGRIMPFTVLPEGHEEYEQPPAGDDALKTQTWLRWYLAASSGHLKEAMKSGGPKPVEALRTSHLPRVEMCDVLYLPLVTPDPGKPLGPSEPRKQHLKLLPRPYLESVFELERYIGSKISFYFAFMCTYVTYLTVLTFSGVCFSIVQFICHVLLDDPLLAEVIVMWNIVVVIVWAAVFKERWMRKASELAHIWQVQNAEALEPPMPEFMKSNSKRDRVPNAITGIKEPKFSNGDRLPRIVVSTLITLTMMAGIIVVMILNVLLRDRFREESPFGGLHSLACSIENGVTIFIADQLYVRVSDKLTKFENYRKRSNKLKSSIIKNFAFRFINGFSGLVITAFSGTTSFLSPPEICDCNQACAGSDWPEAYSHICRWNDPSVNCSAVAYDLTDARECMFAHQTQLLTLQLIMQLVLQCVLQLIFEKYLPKMKLSRLQRIKEEAAKKDLHFPRRLGPFQLLEVEDETTLETGDADAGSAANIINSVRAGVQLHPQSDGTFRYQVPLCGALRMLDSEFTVQQQLEEATKETEEAARAEGVEDSGVLVRVVYRLKADRVTIEEKKGTDTRKDTEVITKRSTTHIDAGWMGSLRCVNKTEEGQIACKYEMRPQKDDVVEVQSEAQDEFYDVQPPELHKLRLLCGVCGGDGRVDRGEVCNQCGGGGEKAHMRCTGVTSPVTPLTFSVEDRKAQGIPEEGSHFVWAYPLESNLLRVRLPDCEEKHRQSWLTCVGAEVRLAGVVGTKAGKLNPKLYETGDVLMHDEGRNWLYVSFAGSHDNPVKTSVHCIDLDEAKGNAELLEVVRIPAFFALPSPDADEAKKDYRKVAGAERYTRMFDAYFAPTHGLEEFIFVFAGAYMYLNEDNKVLSIKAISPSTTGLQFRPPETWRSEFTDHLWKQNRFKPITLQVLRDHGAQYYCWINPKEELVSSIPGNPPWLPTAHGAFVYLFVRRQPQQSTQHKKLANTPDEASRDSERSRRPLTKAEWFHGVGMKQPQKNTKAWTQWNRRMVAWQNAELAEEDTAAPDGRRRPPPPHPEDRFFSILDRQQDPIVALMGEAIRPPCLEEGEFEDYTQVMLHFSYIICFASVLPLSPFFALLTAVFELHTDLWRYLDLSQRPDPVEASGIGAWSQLLSAVILFAVPFNVVLLLTRGSTALIDYGFIREDDQDSEAFFFFVASLVLLAIVYLIRWIVPDRASWVTTELLRLEWDKTRRAAALASGDAHRQQRPPGQHEEPAERAAPAGSQEGGLRHRFPHAH